MADDGSDFARSMSIATSGLRAQAGRMRVISENIANAAFALCTSDFSHTTGLHVPVDAGVAAAFLR